MEGSHPCSTLYAGSLSVTLACIARAFLLMLTCSTLYAGSLSVTIVMG